MADVLKLLCWTPDKEFMDKYRFDFMAHDDLPSPRGEGVDPSDPNACAYAEVKVSRRLDYTPATVREPISFFINFIWDQ